MGMADTRTLVLVGKVGSGKSATGNSILGRDATDHDTFKTGLGLTGVTTYCKMKSTRRDGRTVNVIDTPGMFRPSVGSTEIAKDREKLCGSLAKEGIHAVILVLSVSSRFSEEEETTLEWLQLFFGKRIVDYMILAFTGVDLLKKGVQDVYDYQRTAPPPLKTIIQMCENRVVQFNNKANDKSSQLKQLFHYVDIVMDKNRGKPYSAIPQDNKVETKVERLSRELAKRDDADAENRRLKEKAKELKDKLDKARNKAKEQKDEIHKLHQQLDQQCCCTIS